MRMENVGRLTIGEVARAAGVATTTLRYYEREGLLAPTERSRAGYRLYDDGAVERLAFIRAAQAVESAPPPYKKKKNSKLFCLTFKLTLGCRMEVR